MQKTTDTEIIDIKTIDREIINTETSDTKTIDREIIDTETLTESGARHCVRCCFPASQK